MKCSKWDHFPTMDEINEDEARRTGNFEVIGSAGDKSLVVKQEYQVRCPICDDTGTGHVRFHKLEIVSYQAMEFRA